MDRTPAPRLAQAAGREDFLQSRAPEHRLAGSAAEILAAELDEFVLGPGVLGTGHVAKREERRQHTGVVTAGRGRVPAAEKAPAMLALGLVTFAALFGS